MKKMREKSLFSTATSPETREKLFLQEQCLVKTLDHRDNQYLWENRKKTTHSRATMLIIPIRSMYSERLKEKSRRAECTAANYAVHDGAMREYNWQQQHKLFQVDAELPGQQTAGPSTSAHRAGLSVPRASSSHTKKSLPEGQPVNITFNQKQTCRWFT